MDKLRESLRDLSECGLPIALDAVGERWSFMILRASFNGVQHFEEFLSEIGIARNILANRLSKLTEIGILDRVPCPHDKRKVEYRLTAKGTQLLPAMIALRQWGDVWGTGAPSNPVLADERDRQPILPVSIRSHDGRVLNLTDLCWIEAREIKELCDDCGTDDQSSVRRLSAI